MIERRNEEAGLAEGGERAAEAEAQKDMPGAGAEFQDEDTAAAVEKPQEDTVTVKMEALKDTEGEEAENQDNMSAAEAEARKDAEGGGAGPQGGDMAAAGIGTEENSLQKAGKRKLLWGLVGLVCIGAAIALSIQCIPYIIVRKNVTIEAGEKFPEISAFLRWENEAAEIVSGMEEGEILGHVEERDVSVKLGDTLVTAKLQVVDTLPPRAEFSDQVVYAGKAIPADAFIEAVSDATDCTIEYAQEPEWEEIGIQEVIVAITDEGGNRILGETSLEILEDTTPPVIAGVGEITITEGDSFSYEEGVTVSDNSDEDVTLVVDSSKANPDVPGDYIIVYAAEDEAGNRAEVSTMLHVKKADRTPPVIEGVKDMTVQKGASVSYKRGVTVTDDSGEDVALEIDNSAVNLEEPGDYPVIYSAVDSAGNRTEIEVMIHVREYIVKVGGREEITEDVVWAKADEILASITNESMSSYEVIQAIYNYVHNSVAFSDGSSKNNWVEGAYYGLVKGRGDCYVYAMSSKCLLDRAGIVNMDIERVRVGNSMHFWNLVDIGEGWHHFDTCRRADGSTFFYLTDAELMAYSDTHISSEAPYGTHYYDRTLYPEIP